MKVLPISLCLIYRYSKSLEILFQIRNEDGELDGMLELPGGKINKNELPIDAAIRELFEETGIQAKASELTLFKIHNHEYYDRSVQLHIYVMHDKNSEISMDFTEINKNDELINLNIPNANKIFLSEFLNYLDEQG